MKKNVLFTVVLALFAWTGMMADSWTEDFSGLTGNSYLTEAIELTTGTWVAKDAGNGSYGNSTMGSHTFTINDDKDSASITTPALTGCGYISFEYAYKSGSSTNVFVLQKSTDSINFVDVATQELGASAEQNFVTFMYNINDNSPEIYLRILSDDQNAHLFIDNFMVTDYGTEMPKIPSIVPITPTSGDAFVLSDPFLVSATVTTEDVLGIDSVVLAYGDIEDALADSVTMSVSGDVYSTYMYLDEVKTFYAQIIAYGANGEVAMGAVSEAIGQEFYNFEMASSQYQIIVDTVNARSDNTVSYNETVSENYYGAAANYSNFSEGDGKYSSIFASYDAAIEEALSTILLPAIRPAAVVYDTIAVSYATFDGSNSGTESMSFVCTSIEPLTFEFIIPLDTIAPEWSEGYPYLDNATANSFDIFLQASEDVMVYGALYDTLPNVTPTKEEIMARVLADDEAGMFPVGIDAFSTIVEVEESEHIYYIYAFIKDLAGNESAEVVMMSDTTLVDSGIDVFAGEDFEDRATGPYSNSGWLNVVKSGSTTGWDVTAYDGNQYAQFSSYNGTGEDTVLLISPNVDMTLATDNMFSFDVNTGYYNAPCLKVFIAEDYDGADPTTATWVEVTDSFTFVENTSSYGTLASAGTLSLEAYEANVAFAFEYAGNGEDSRTSTFQLDNIAIAGKLKSFTTVTEFKDLSKVDITVDSHLFSINDLLSEDLLPDSIEGMVDGVYEKFELTGWTMIEGSVFSSSETDTLVAYIELPAGYKYDGDLMVKQTILFSTPQTVVVLDKLNLTFDASLDGCRVINVLGETAWGLDSYGYAKVNTYGSGANESWLVTPAVNFDALTNPSFTFDVASYNANKKISDCGAEQFEVYYSATAQPGVVNASDWTRFTDVDDVTLGDKWGMVNVNVNLTGVSGSQVYFAFRHVSDDSNGTTWEVDNIMVDADATAVNDINALDLAIYPNPATSTIQLTKAVDAVEVINLAGSSMLRATAVAANQMIDITSLNAGIYMVKATVNGTSTISKLVKK